jgi:predicted nucleotidyltransferase
MENISLQGIRDRKEKRRQLLQSELKRISEQLIEMGALKIIVFGSYAEGHVRSNSDLDIIAIMPPILSGQNEMRGKDWMGKVYEEIDRGVDCDILCYTPQELEVLIPVSRFVRHALETGKVIYETES